MTKYLSEEDFEFRRLVAELEGHQVAIAFCLQITANAVSHRLHTQKHRAWWRAFKKRRSKQRKAERQRRYRVRRLFDAKV